METAISLRLSASSTLNLVIDESTHIAGYRIINTSAIANNSNCFYISSIKANIGKLGVEELAIAAVKKITNRDLSKVGS